MANGILLYLKKYRPAYQPTLVLSLIPSWLFEQPRSGIASLWISRQYIVTAPNLNYIILQIEHISLNTFFPYSSYHAIGLMKTDGLFPTSGSKMASRRQAN
jgi:hypothetical protein